MRCDTGAALHRKWADEVKAASYATWQDVFWGGLKEYEAHAKSCPECLEVELRRMDKYRPILSKAAA